jgi:hypothetical protein
MLGLELFDGRGRLDVDADTSIQFEQNFNLHDFEHVEGTKSWRFKLPKTANNLRLTGWVNLPELRSSFENNFKIRVNLAGTLWKVGLLYFIDDADAHWNVHFAGEAGLLKKLIGDLKLTDIDYPLTTGINDMHAHALATTTASIGTYDHVFVPIELDAWADQNPAATARGINVLDVDTLYNFNGFATTAFNHPVPMVPFPFVISVLKHIANALGFRVGGDIITDTEMQRLLFFNVKPLNDLAANSLPTSTIATEIDLANHLPETKISEFLVEFCKLFNQTILYDDANNALNFKHRPSILKEPVVGDLRYKATDLQMLYNERRTYNLAYEISKADLARFPDDPASSMRDMVGIDDVAGSTDVVSKIGVVPNFETPYTSLILNAETPLQLFFYRGYIQNWFSLTGDDLPAALGNLNYTPGTGLIKDRYSLTWRGEGNLYDTWWRSFFESLKLARVVRLHLLLSNFDVLSFRSDRVYALLDFIGLFEELKINFNGERMMVECQFLKL